MRRHRPQWLPWGSPIEPEETACLVARGRSRTDDRNEEACVRVDGGNAHSVVP
ncbi:hypothetical protein ACIRTB_33465 [Streptomyces sp. NPDC101158]|uniref:hypothetical protein n=1 Tax=Streptomyces sp. NPDC101158 TaxID=3366117 RepID=UPI0037FFDE9A